MDGWMDGRTDGWMEGRKEGRKGKDHPCVSENGAKQASCAFVKSV